MVNCIGCVSWRLVCDLGLVHSSRDIHDYRSLHGATLVVVDRGGWPTFRRRGEQTCIWRV